MVYSKKELQSVFKLGNKIYLRKNIEKVTIDDEEQWKAEEVSFNLNELNKQPTLQEIEDNFDIYYQWAEQKRENEDTQKQKAKKVKELINKDYTLADLKETVDQLVKDSLI